MGAPIIYRWDDTDAPIADGIQGTFIEILDACLVNGYGAKPAAGWTKEFVDLSNTKAVYRNDPIVGTGMFLRVDCTWNTASYNHMPKLDAYETMADVDTGIGPFRNPTEPIYAHLSQSNNHADPRIWILVADNRCFYFFCYTYASVTNGIQGMIDNREGTTGYGSAPLFFGDIVSIVSDDPYGCAIIGATGISTNYGSHLMAVGYTNLSPASDATGQTLARYFSGANKVSGTGIVTGGGTTSITSPGNTGMSRSHGIDMMSRPHLLDDSIYTIRGWLPGFYHPGHRYTDFDPFEIVAIDGKQVICLWGNGISSNQQGAVLIDIGTTFRP